MRALNSLHPLGMALVGALAAAPLAAQDEAVTDAVEAASEAAADAANAAMAKASEKAMDAAEGIPELQPAPPPPISVQPAPPPGPRDPQPTGDGYNWFRGAVLPADLYLQEAKGSVRYEMAVDADGKPTACSVAESTGFPGLDDFTCATAMKVAEFEPALDAEGNAVAGTFTDRHYWRFRKHELDAFSLTISAIVRSDGTVLNCRVLNEEGTVPKAFPGDKPCTGLTTTGPWRDANGEPQDRIVRFTVSVESEAPPEPLVIKRETPAE